MRTVVRSHISLIGEKMKVKSNAEILEFCKEYGQSIGVEVVEVEFKQGKNPALTIYIDKEGGIDLDACEQFHRLIDQPLDELDPTYGVAYTLNVSSLGADRPFRTEKDFLSHIGQKVEVKLNTAIKSKKFYEGELISFNGQSVVIKVDAKNTLSIDMKNIVKVNEYIDFN